MEKTAYRIRNVKTGLSFRVESRGHGFAIVAELAAIYGTRDWLVEAI
jgi:hypothetical protein